MEKIQKLDKTIKRYAESLKAILNIITTHVGEISLGDNFQIDDRTYKNCINTEIYKNWITRHAFIDVFELTRELMLIVFIDIFSDDVHFEENKKSHLDMSVKRRQNKKLSPTDILEILRIDKEFEDFSSVYNEYNNCRNCLTHRTGDVTKDDLHPITITYHRYQPIVKTSHEIIDFNNKKDFIKYTNNNLKDKESIGFKLTKKRKTYSIGETIIISNEDIFGISWTLYRNIEKILEKALPEHANNIKVIFNRYNMFEVRKISIEYYIE